MQRIVHSVGILGLTPADTRLVALVCTLSERRPRSYTLIRDEQVGKSPDVLIVDGDDASAMTRAHRLRESAPALPIILIYADEVPVMSTAQFLRKRSVPGHLLHLLDRVMESIHPTPAEDAPAAAMPKSARVTGAASVLVVDDSLIVRNQIGACLDEMGMQAVFAASVGEAMKLLGERYFDLALLDVVLPDGDGYQICKSIKRVRALDVLPVVMLTSKSAPFDRVRGALAGCDAYLTKPVNRNEFRNTLRKFARLDSARA